MYNTNAVSLSLNPVFHTRTKHIKIDVHFVRERVENKELEVKYVPTELQKAIIFTKALSSTKFCFLRDKVNLVSPELSLRGVMLVRKQS